MSAKKKLPKIGFLYFDYVLRFFNKSNFKGWPDKIETVTYHWKNDKKRFIKEVKNKKIKVLIGNIPATAYEIFKEIAKELPKVRFVPSIETQFSNKSKENVTLFCEKYKIAIPKTKIFYDLKKGDKFLKNCVYPKIIKRSYGPSNYGGHYVHKVESYEEARVLFDKRNYSPMYIQKAISLKDDGDIRIMLIGHKPVCAFWRYSKKGEWITNTSQGGKMSYDSVPMSALELAVKSSKAAKAEYWACDIGIDKKTNKPYIIECATAFAAFPYIRDWICQYIMWDLSKGYFKMPHVPLFSWEELGKMNSCTLRTLRNIRFSKYTPSTDGTFYLNSPELFDMQKVENSYPADAPCVMEVLTGEDNLPQDIKDALILGEKSTSLDEEKLYFKSITLTDLLSLYGMEEDSAIRMKTLIEKNKINSLEDLKKYDFISSAQMKKWEKLFHEKTL